MLEHIQEWHSPDFQNLRFHLLVLVGILASIAGFGIQMRGPRLVTFAMLLVLGLSYTRGLTSFFLLTPILLAKPISDRIAWCSLHSDVSDPVLLYLKTRAGMIPMIFLGITILGTAASWHDIGIGPPESVAPKAAVNFTRTAGIKGNVFNSYGFGGYLIFSGIPTFIDGRIPPYSDDFVRRTFAAIDLVDINDAFRLLDEYKVNWILLRPQEPLTKALARSHRWRGVYSDKYSIVFVRHR